MDTEEIKALVSKVDGWLSDDEGMLLYSLSSKCPKDAVVVEIGSWKGKSTIWLAKGSKQGGNVKVYAVDHHKGGPELVNYYNSELWTYDEFMDNIRNANVQDTVIPIVKTSSDASKDFNQPIGLLFIDGDHEYAGVRSDLECWFPKVVDNGIIAFHDAIRLNHKYGVRKATKELVFRSRHFKDISFKDSIVYATKVKQNSFSDRIRNRVALLFTSMIILKSYIERILG